MQVQPKQVTPVGSSTEIIKRPFLLPFPRTLQKPIPSSQCTQDSRTALCKSQRGFTLIIRRPTNRETFLRICQLLDCVPHREEAGMKYEDRDKFVLFHVQSSLIPGTCRFAKRGQNVWPIDNMICSNGCSNGSTKNASCLNEIIFADNQECQTTFHYPQHDPFTLPELRQWQAVLQRFGFQVILPDSSNSSSDSIDFR